MSPNWCTNTCTCSWLGDSAIWITLLNNPYYYILYIAAGYPLTPQCTDLQMSTTFTKLFQLSVEVWKGEVRQLLNRIFFFLHKYFTTRCKLHKKVTDIKYPTFSVWLIYAIRARIAYMNYTKKLRIFNILNFLCSVYMHFGPFGFSTVICIHSIAANNPVCPWWRYTY